MSMPGRRFMLACAPLLLFAYFVAAMGGLFL